MLVKLNTSVSGRNWSRMKITFARQHNISYYYLVKKTRINSHPLLLFSYPPGFDTFIMPSYVIRSKIVRWTIEGYFKQSYQSSKLLILEALFQNFGLELHSSMSQSLCSTLGSLKWKRYRNALLCNVVVPLLQIFILKR